MPTLKSTFTADKPWGILGMTCRPCAAAKPGLTPGTASVNSCAAYIGQLNVSLMFPHATAPHKFGHSNF